MGRLLVALLIVANATLAFAQISWEKLSNGEHTFKTLGEGFYVEVPVKRIENARVQLSFVNVPLVKRLGLELPADPADTEKMLLDLFGWQVDPAKTSPKKWFATHYMDGSQKGPGEAMGDGRALWTGELQLTAADGKILYVDAIQKGVGITPFAWLKNKGHNDGTQNTGELIRSGIKSIADIGNQLDSTGDVLGFTVTRADGTVTSQTLRLGRQTRPAHLAFHSDSEVNQKKMMDYIVKRDLGLRIDTVVTRDLFVKWAMKFAANNGEDTARFYALNAFFEQPTKGNKTTTGGSIDLNGRQYLDAYHTELKHLYFRLAVGEQVSLQRGYIDMITRFLKSAKYRHYINSPGLEAEMEEMFDVRFRETAMKMHLSRLGLTDFEVAKLDPKTKLELFEAVDSIMRALGTKSVALTMGNDSVVPAAFDTRKILKGTMAALALKDTEARTRATNELFKVDFAWATDSAENNQKLRARYLAVVDKVISELGGKIPRHWVDNAVRRTSKQRFDSSKDGLWDVWANPIREMAESGMVLGVGGVFHVSDHRRSLGHFSYSKLRVRRSDDFRFAK